MKTINKKVFLTVLLLTLCLAASTISIRSQEKPIKEQELLNWIDDDETKTDIKALITKQKLDFEAKPETLSKIKDKWKNVKLEDMPGDLEQCIRENALQLAATLIVECANAQCKLFMNGESLGEASPGNPFLKPGLPLGKAIIRATAKGYKTKEQYPTLVPGENRIPAFTMELPTAKLSVGCTNTPCELFLNEKSLGTADRGKYIEEDGLKLGKAKVEAKAKGYKDYESQITLIEGDQAEPISFTMTLLGSLSVTCEPVDCEVYVDRIPKGKTSQKQLSLKDLPDGNYDIEASARGFVPSSKIPVSVKAGVDTPVPLITLKRLPFPEEIKNAMLDSFFKGLELNTNVNYVAAWDVTSVKTPANPVRVKQTVAGSAVNWTGSEHISTLDAYSRGFNIYDILSRIRSSQGGLTLSGQDLGDDESKAIGKVAEPISEPAKYIRLIAEDKSDLYELTLEYFYPSWLPVMISHKKKDSNSETRTVASPIKGYATRKGSKYFLPEFIRIFDPKTWTIELEAKLVDVK